MFRNNTTATVADATVDTPGYQHTDDLVPLSVLALDLAAPGDGWHAYLANRGIEVVTDDIGRDAVSRDGARMLLTEQREAEARRREKWAAAEQQAVEADRVRRASIWGGVPADLLPPGVAPAAVMLQASRDARPRRVTPLQEALAGEGMTYHPLQDEADES